MDLFNRKRVAELKQANANLNWRLEQWENTFGLDLISWRNQLRNDIAIHNRALSRFIAKLDPIFAEDEMSPARKAESDKITEAVLKKLVAEHLASRVPGDG